MTAKKQFPEKELKIETGQMHLVVWGTVSGGVFHGGPLSPAGILGVPPIPAPTTLTEPSHRKEEAGLGETRGPWRAHAPGGEIILSPVGF